MPYILLYIFIFLYGIVIGSFLNVVILRVPEGESLITKRSHCTSCSHVLHWYDLFPLFSYVFLKGHCRYCGAKISAQYPIIEASNGILWVLMFLICGFSPRKTIRLAKIAYGEEFSDEELLRWLRSWCRRLFSQQFYRSCLMDGPSVGSFSVSPRTGFQMPSDAEAALFMKDLDLFEEELLPGDRRSY